VLAFVGNCGTIIGGAATEEPMLVQPLLEDGAAGFDGTLRSTGAAGSVEPQVDVAGAVGVSDPVGQGGGAKLREVELAGGAAGCVANGLVNFDG
jgi:hypothetical protein